MACSVTTNAVVNAFATGMIAGMMPVYGIQVGDWSFNISPQLARAKISSTASASSMSLS